ncbi:MAG TPA: hypothetical protein VGM37_15140 [Armatimonadota bacterium]|jgi:hypothetical protein
MTPYRPTNIGRLDADFREALAEDSAAETPECLDLSRMLQAIEDAESGAEPAELEHVAACRRCRKLYVSLRGAFAEADALRGAQRSVPAAGASGATSARPERAARGDILSAIRLRLETVFARPAMRLGMAGATAFAAAAFGYVIGEGQAPLQVAPVVARAEPANRTARDLRETRAALNRLRAENSRLRQQGRAGSRVAAPPSGVSGLRPVAPTHSSPGVAPVDRSVAALGRPLVRIAAADSLAQRGGGAPGATSLSPARTWVLSDRPEFRCSFPGAGPETRYAAQVEAASGDRLTAAQTGSSLKWHPAYRLLRGEKASWTVTARVGDREYSATGRFGVLTEGEADRVRVLAGRTAGIDKARVYRRAGLMLDALAFLETIPASSPHGKEAGRMLSEIRNAMRPEVEWRESEASDSEQGGGAIPTTP